MREHNLPREVNGKAFLTRWSASPARWAPRLFAAKAGWCLKNTTSPYPLVVHECLSPLPRLLLPKVTLLDISMGRDNTRTLTLGASSSLNTLEVTLDTPFYSSFKAPLRYSNQPSICCGLSCPLILVALKLILGVVAASPRHAPSPAATPIFFLPR